MRYSMQARNRALVAVVAVAAVVALALASTATAAPSERYREHLDIEPLADGKVLFSFEFVAARPAPPVRGSAAAVEAFGLFPRTLGQILAQSDVAELDLAWTQGRWRTDRWGYAANGTAAPPGADLKAWFRSGGNDVDARWTALTNSLAGLFCGSLNFLDSGVLTAHPVLTYGGGDAAARGLELRHASLAREAVCTENLTPWTKLLPCHGARGLAAALNGYRLFDADYVSIQTRVAHVAGEQEMTQRIIAVLDPLRQVDNRPDWSLVGLLDRVPDTVCPMATAPTTVHVAMPRGVPEDEFDLLPEQFEMMEEGGRRFAAYDLAHIVDSPTAAHVPVHVTRYTTGSAQDRGVLAVDLRHAAPVTSAPVGVVYYDVLPWFMRVYLHTLVVRCGPLDAPADSWTSVTPNATWAQHARDRVRPTVVELAWSMPAGHGCGVRADFDKAFLHYTEHRPDANRGFEVGAAVITLTLPTDTPATVVPAAHAAPATSPRVVRVPTELLQIQLPTPDFSMPYNVITFTCTVLAFFFGTLFAMTVKRTYSYRLVDGGEAAEKEKTRKCGRLLARFRGGGKAGPTPAVVTIEHRIRAVLAAEKAAAEDATGRASR
ncbi:Subunit of the glycosylphosphatidylinositol transamidase complex-like protein [Blastocladiella emersonii ATCC 22665]|nr:Subunit of the glycosylphosphatidylinositol transamidase complex-like protein [Blastocladiella emersonii ATCC 22665]